MNPYWVVEAAPFPCIQALQLNETGFNDSIAERLLVASSEVMLILRRRSDAEQFVADEPLPRVQVTAEPVIVVLPLLATEKTVVVAFTVDEAMAKSVMFVSPLLA